MSNRRGPNKVRKSKYFPEKYKDKYEIDRERYKEEKTEKNIQNLSSVSDEEFSDLIVNINLKWS